MGGKKEGCQFIFVEECSIGEKYDDILDSEIFVFPELEKLGKMNSKTWIKSGGIQLANQVEQIHANLFKKAIDTLKEKKPMEKVDYYVCGVCGNTVEGESPQKCPICGAPKEKFYKTI